MDHNFSDTMTKPLAHDPAMIVDVEGHVEGWQVVTSKRKARALSHPELASFQPALADTGISGLSLSSSAEENKPHGRQSSLAPMSQSKNRLQDHLSRKNGSASFPKHANPPTITPLCVSNSFQTLTHRPLWVAWHLASLHETSSRTSKHGIPPSSTAYSHTHVRVHESRESYKQRLPSVEPSTHQPPAPPRSLRNCLPKRRFHDRSSIYRSIPQWGGRRFTDLLALRQLALYDFARDQPITKLTIFINWYTFALASSSPHLFKEDLSGICEILPQFKGFRSVKVEWQNIILEASEESRRVGIRTNFAYEFLKRLHLPHPEITIELAHWSGAPTWIDVECKACKKVMAGYSNLLDAMEGIEEDC